MTTHALRRLDHLTFDLMHSEGRMWFAAGKLTKGLPRIEGMTARCDVCKAELRWKPAHSGSTEITDALAARTECRAFLELHWPCGANGKPVPEHFGEVAQ